MSHPQPSQQRRKVGKPPLLEGERPQERGWRVRIELAPAVRLNTLGLKLPRRSVRERFRLTHVAVSDIIARMQACHGVNGPMRVDPIVRGGIAVALEVSSLRKHQGLSTVLKSLKSYLEHDPAEGESLFDCADDVTGFVELVRQQIPATAVTRKDGFAIRYSSVGERILVKELLELPDDEPRRLREFLVGKTMFRDYIPEDFAAVDLDGLFDGLGRFYGLLRDSLEEVLARPDKALRALDEDDDPWEEAIAVMGGPTSSAIVAERIEKDAETEFAETMTFYDRRGRRISTSAFSESEFSSDENVSRWRNLIDIRAFLAENMDRLWLVAVRTAGRDHSRLAALYMRNVKVLASWEKQDLDGVAYLPLYEFFCNYGLPELAAQMYEAYGIEIDITRAAAVISVLGKWESRGSEVSQALRSLRNASAPLVVVDLRYAANAPALAGKIKSSLEKMQSHQREIRIVAGPQPDEELESQLAELLPEVGVFASVEEALREPPANFSQD